MTLLTKEQFEEWKHTCFSMPDWFTSNREEELRRWHEAMPKLPIWFEDFNEASVMFLMEELEGKF